MHPLSEELQEVRFGKRAGPGMYAGWPEWEQRASDALDAYHEALDGLEIVECEWCRGTSIHTCRGPGERVWIGQCRECLGAGKRLRKKEV